MNQGDRLREMLAEMLILSPDQIGPQTPLASLLSTSLGGARLKIGLKRLGLSLPDGFSPLTFAELEAALSGTPPEKGLPVPTVRANHAPVETAHVTRTGIHVGIDVQDLRSLPVVPDYWENDFYAGMFGKSEIAYAVTQSEPRTHLAGFWCAKEALRKCDPSFTNVGFEAISVAHDQYGKPYLVMRSPSGEVRLPHALSVSHTGELATAIVIALAGSPDVESPRKITSAPVSESSRVPDTQEVSGRTKFLLSSTALLVIAVVFLLIRHFWIA